MTIGTFPDMSSEEPGLRARKKQRTRETIVEVAMRLFAERGFDGTTIADIAAAADIAPRTFFGYFPSKEAVVFHEHDELLASFAARLQARRPGETAFDALRAWLLELIATLGVDDPHGDVRRRLIAETPALAAHDRANRAQLETVLAEAVAVDLGTSADALAPHLAAAAAIATLDALDRYYDGHAQPEAVKGILDEALAFLHGGLRALPRKPAAGARGKRRP
ncbi:MAG: TetR family transcriptional regulator [Actinobacteria bacterium]|nr:TetR family transcriptional regulator [Actinomycetota bacterium]